VVDRWSSRRVSKNHIGGVKVSRIASSVVDHEFIGGVMVRVHTIKSLSSYNNIKIFDFSQMF
jgi:hypothetical protein